MTLLFGLLVLLVVWLFGGLAGCFVGCLRVWLGGVFVWLGGWLVGLLG